MFLADGGVFRQRERKAGIRNAHLLRGEPIEQVKNGRRPRPTQLGAGGKPRAWRPNIYNISSRFGPLQSDKLRSCGDLERPMANLACAGYTPIPLASRGHIARISQLLANGGCDFIRLEADREAGYKQMPADPRGRRNSILAFRRPETRRRRGFFARALISGSIADVYHYDVLSGIATTLANRYLGLDLIGFFGDFAASPRKRLVEEALRAFHLFCELLRTPLNPGKYEGVGA